MSFKVWKESRENPINVEELAKTFGDSKEEFLNNCKETYGLCPKCGEPGILQEKRLNGNTICPNRHKFGGDGR